MKCECEWAGSTVVGVCGAHAEFMRYQTKDLPKWKYDARRYRAIRERISDRMLGKLMLRNPRPSEQYEERLDKIVDDALAHQL